MSDESPTLAVLIRVPSELEAAMIVSLLGDHGLDSVADGGFTAGFRAEAPGDVAVRVRREDLVAARQILADAKRGDLPQG